ncbi:MAG: DUF1844 domain-containing protein [Candidatus Sumerlaea chitinivorans]|jgi:hypothetical protein|nr:DUF1844 domain-containing protein [Candidatus Sumerlaea chitinivorans]
MSEQTSANFYLLVQTHAMQALLACQGGTLGDKTIERDLGLARVEISLLEMLQEKTRGNLTTEEAAFLADALHECRMAFVRAVDEEAKAKPKEKTSATESSGSGDGDKPSEVVAAEAHASAEATAASSSGAPLDSNGG